MAAVNFFDSFGYTWAQTGNADSIQDDQYKVGWAYIGSTPPSVEQFNKWGQLSDEKHSWLFNQIKGVTDSAGLVLSSGASDTLLEAIQSSTMLILPTAPATLLSSTIYVEDREQILRWKTLGAYTGYISPDVGCISFGTQPNPRPFEVDLIGQTLDKTNTKYAALHAWATAAGLFVASGAWTAGTYFFAEMGGNLFKVPDLRNMFIRFTGTDIDTANVRALGSWQKPSIISGDFDANGTYAALGLVTTTSNSRASLGIEPPDPGIYGGGGSVGANAVTQNVTTVAGVPTAFGAVRPVNTALHPRMYL